MARGRLGRRLVPAAQARSDPVRRSAARFLGGFRCDEIGETGLRGHGGQLYASQFRQRDAVGADVFEAG